MKMYFITGNKGKFEEVQQHIPTIEQLAIDLPEIQEVDARVIIEAKLQVAFLHHKGAFIVEDTSLYLDCLNGLPGPLIKWFLKTMGKEGLFELSQKFNNTKATAKTIIGFAGNKKDIRFFDGEVTGHIVAPQGQSGFGWDALFMPFNATKTFAQMTREEKNTQEMSMRARAVSKLKEFLLQESKFL